MTISSTSSVPRDRALDGAGAGSESGHALGAHWGAMRFRAGGPRHSSEHALETSSRGTSKGSMSSAKCGVSVAASLAQSSSAPAAGTSVKIACPRGLAGRSQSGTRQVASFLSTFATASGCLAPWCRLTPTTPTLHSSRSRRRTRRVSARSAWATPTASCSRRRRPLAPPPRRSGCHLQRSSPSDGGPFFRRLSGSRPPRFAWACEERRCSLTSVLPSLRWTMSCGRGWGEVSRLGLSWSVMAAIQALHSGRRHWLQWCPSEATLFTVGSGVRQGCPSSPIFFAAGDDPDQPLVVGAVRAAESTAYGRGRLGRGGQELVGTRPGLGGGVP